MHETSASAETSVWKQADIFTTFLYAAAIHIVIAEFFQSATEKTFSGSLLLFFIIIYLLCDWINRVRLPRLTSDPRKVWHRLAKTFLETIGIVLYILATVLFVSGEMGLKEAFAGSFLLVAFLWNLVQLHAMKGLDLVPLLKDIFRGTVLDMPAIQQYANVFYTYSDDVREELKDYHKQCKEANRTAGQEFRQSLTLSFSLYMLIIQQAFLRTFAQSVGLHLGIENALIGGVLLLQGLTTSHELWPALNQFLMQLNCKYMIWPLIILIILVTGVTANYFRMQRLRALCYGCFMLGALLVGTVFYFTFTGRAQPAIRWISYFALIPTLSTLAFALNGERKESFFNYLGAALTYTIGLVGCLGLPPNLLILVVGIEQIFMSVFLQIVTGVWRG